MPVHHAQRIQPGPAPQFWHQEIQGAECDHAVPAKRPGMDVTNGPVRVMRQRIHRLDRHHRTLKGRHAVKCQRDNHHAQNRIGTHLVPGTGQGHQAVDHAAPGRHPQHDREHHAQGLCPVRQRGVVQMMRSGPDIKENQAPEMDDREPIGIDRTVGLFGYKIIHHAEESGRQEKADSVVAVPPLRQRILYTGK